MKVSSVQRSQIRKNFSCKAYEDDVFSLDSVSSFHTRSSTDLLHVSQRMTFLYSPRLGNRSSRPVTKPTAMISKVWWPCGTSNLDRMIAPLRMRVDTVLYPCACVVRPSEMTLYKEAYWPLAVSQS